MTSEKDIILALLNHYLSLATILGAIFVLLWGLVLVYGYLANQKLGFLKSISRTVYPLGFLVTFLGAFLTLFYSEYLHVLPCDLCWFQRVFLYPQIFMFAYAWYKKDRGVLPYSLMLSILGFSVALYHHVLQLGYDIYKPCSTAPFAIDCAKPSFIEYGFVTFPFMAVVLFGFLILLVLSAQYLQKK
jgi:disulfide bond formation protein DsbB